MYFQAQYIIFLKESDDTYGKRDTNHRLSFRHFLLRRFFDRAFSSLRCDIQSCIHIEKKQHDLYHAIRQRRKMDGIICRNELT